MSEPKDTVPPQTPVPVYLIPQTGMPPIYFSRSREVLYDALQNEKTFIFNKFGPQRLDLCRPNMHW